MQTCFQTFIISSVTCHVFMTRGPDIKTTLRQHYKHRDRHPTGSMIVNQDLQGKQFPEQKQSILDMWN